jgi:hypothetical protein
MRDRVLPTPDRLRRLAELGVRLSG